MCFQLSETEEKFYRHSEKGENPVDSISQEGGDRLQVKLGQ